MVSLLGPLVTGVKPQASDLIEFCVCDQTAERVAFEQLKITEPSGEVTCVEGDVPLGHSVTVTVTDLT